MSCDKKNVPAMNPVVRTIVAWSLALAALCASPAALAVDSGDIVVVSTKGEVHFTVGGAAREVRAGGVLELPASLRTGRDGAVELRQGATTVSVGPETVLDFPALEKRGAPIDRIVQPRGNAFYNIGKREGRKLRVETPYLVGVIKGTQFNVAAFDDSTTISLFEGLLEVRATDESDVVDLKAGEIASRKRGDKSISVMKMDGGKAPTTAPRATSGSGSNDSTPAPDAPSATPSSDGGDSVLVDRSGGVESVIPRAVETLGGTEASVGLSVSAGAANGIEVGVDAGANVANAASVNMNAALNADSTGVDLAAGARVDAGPVAVDTVAAVNVDVAVAGVDVSTSTSVDAGPVAVDLAGGAAVDLTSATIDTAASAGVDAGPLTTDVGAAAGADLGAGAVGASIDVAAATPLAAVDVGASTAVDVAAGTVDLGLTVAGTDLNLGLDLGLDNAVSTPDPGSTTTDAGTDSGNTTTVVDVGGLLDGLLRRPGRR